MFFVVPLQGIWVSCWFSVGDAYSYFCCPFRAIFGGVHYCLELNTNVILQ